MKNLAKLIIVFVFGIVALFMFLRSIDLAGIGSSVLAQVAVRPTPTPSAANTARNTNGAANANVNAATPTPPVVGNKTMTKIFTLSKDSQDEHGEVLFDHENHAFKNYSPDGKSVIGCVECHHTDQPKSALKPPLLKSERDVALTFDSWKATPQKVSECRFCHFQEGSVPDDKTMPTATYSVGGVKKVKELNNELAYHINCNICHDAAYKLRPDLKSKPATRFATAKDCLICHTKN